MKTKALILTAILIMSTFQGSEQPLADVERELAYMQCAVDYRAVHKVRFKYNMRETCVNIMNGEAVL